MHICMTHGHRQWGDEILGAGIEGRTKRVRRGKWGEKEELCKTFNNKVFCVFFFKGLCCGVTLSESAFAICSLGDFGHVS